MKHTITFAAAAALAAPALGQTVTIVNDMGLYTLDLDFFQTTQVVASTDLVDVAASDQLGEAFVRSLAQSYSVVNLSGGSVASTGVASQGGAFGEGNNGLWYTSGDSATVAGSVLTAIDPRSTSVAPQPVVDFGSRIGDIAALPNGRVFASLDTGDLVEVDVNTGAFSTVLNVGKTFEGLASTAAGDLWGFTAGGSAFFISPDAGTAFDEGKIGMNVLDAGSQIAIPAPAGMLVLAGLPMFTRRKR